MTLTEEERMEVEHWRRWCQQGGRALNYAPMAIEPLIAIIDRCMSRSPQESGHD